MLHVRAIAPVVLPAGLKLHKLAPELLAHRRHLLKAISPEVHEVVKPVNFVAGDELRVEGEILGPLRAKLMTRDGKTEISVGEYYRRQSEAASREDGLDGARVAMAEREKVEAESAKARRKLL